MARNRYGPRGKRGRGAAPELPYPTGPPRGRPRATGLGMSAPPSVVPKNVPPPIIGKPLPPRIRSDPNADLLLSLEAIYGPQRQYIENLIYEQKQEAAKQAAWQRKWYEDMAKWISGAIPGAISSAYSTAAQNQSLFGQGFSDAALVANQASAGDVNAVLTDIGAPAGQIIGPGQGAAARDVSYGLGGWLPANTLNQQGAAFSSAAAMQVPAYLADAAGKVAAYLSQSGKDISTLRGDLAKLASERGAAIYQTKEQRRTERLARQERNKTADRAEKWRRKQWARQERADKENRLIRLLAAKLITPEQFEAEMRKIGYDYDMQAPTPGPYEPDLQVKKIGKYTLNWDKNTGKFYLPGSKVPLTRNELLTMMAESAAPEDEDIQYDIIAQVNQAVSGVYKGRKGVLARDKNGKVIPGKWVVEPLEVLTFEEALEDAKQWEIEGDYQLIYGIIESVLASQYGMKKTKKGWQYTRSGLVNLSRQTGNGSPNGTGIGALRRIVKAYLPNTNVNRMSRKELINTILRFQSGKKSGLGVQAEAAPPVPSANEPEPSSSAGSTDSSGYVVTNGDRIQLTRILGRIPTPQDEKRLLALKKKYGRDALADAIIRQAFGV